jgi:hypothetical protein
VGACFGFSLKKRKVKRVFSTTQPSCQEGKIIHFLWRRENEPKRQLFSYFLAQKEAKTSTLTKASPYMERMQTQSRRNRRL